MKNYITLLIFLTLVVACSSQNKVKTNISPIDLQILDSLKNDVFANNMHPKFLDVASFFIGTPYVGGVLDKSSKEELVINLHELDCVTYIENVLSIYAIIDTSNFNSKFCKELKRLRYRNNRVEGYISRLHYYTEWLYRNVEKGILVDKTKDFGGILYSKHIDFMSKNYTRYKFLSNNPSLVKQIKEKEKYINSLNFYYIPKENIAKIESQIEDGDIMLITTNIPGLDVSHLGLAVWKNSHIHLLNASSRHKKVEISDKSLIEYLMDNKLQTGIMIARLKKDISN